MRLKFLGSLICVLAFQVASRPIAGKTITDSKVVDLPCDRIQEINIFEYLHEDFHHRENRFHIANWGFRAGSHEISRCWSLSRNQRLSFYLADYDHIPSDTTTVQNSLNMFRRWTPRLSGQSIKPLNKSSGTAVTVRSSKETFAQTSRPIYLKRLPRRPHRISSL